MPPLETAHHFTRTLGGFWLSGLSQPDRSVARADLRKICADADGQLTRRIRQSRETAGCATVADNHRLWHFADVRMVALLLPAQWVMTPFERF